MNQREIEEKLRTGRLLFNFGIFALVATFLGACVAGAMSASNGGNAALDGFELGQSPFLSIGMVVGITLIVLGQVRKSNARAAQREHYLHDNSTVEVVSDEESAAPFRPDAKEVKVLDPTVAAVEEGILEADRKKGTVFLCVGGAIMVVTVILMLTTGGGGGTIRAMERIMLKLGMAFFPFALGLFFCIKGLLLRSK